MDIILDLELANMLKPLQPSCRESIERIFKSYDTNPIYIEIDNAITRHKYTHKISVRLSATMVSKFRIGFGIVNLYKSSSGKWVLIKQITGGNRHAKMKEFITDEGTLTWANDSVRELFNIVLNGD